ncbi:MAG: hydratase [Cyanobacteria bacterium P01_D01_bin.105]
MVKTCFWSVALVATVALFGGSRVGSSRASAFEVSPSEGEALDGEARESLEQVRSPSSRLIQSNLAKFELAQVNIDSAGAELADYFLQRQPIPDLLFGQSEADAVSLSLSEASDLRDQFVYELMPELGPIVGYKAGLTSAAAQARFGVEHPLRGVLLQDMLLESGATVPVSFGARPLFEADLIVRVGNSAINEAETPEEALAALDAVIPFIELPDVMFGPDAMPDAASLIAINVGARMGVVGSAIPIEATEAWMTILGNLQVDIVDDTGAIIAEGNSSALLGHPLEAVLWLRDDLKQAGLCLRPGDLLSLGSITAPAPVLGPQTLRVRYEGLGENGLAEVVVTFE